MDAVDVARRRAGTPAGAPRGARGAVRVSGAPRAHRGAGRRLVGSADNVYRIGSLGELVARYVPRAVEIEWYGNPQGIAWDDPELEIPWPLDTAAAILSLKDRDLPRLADIDSPFFCQPDAAHATA